VAAASVRSQRSCAPARYALLVNHISGAPTTPAPSITSFNLALPTKDFAASMLANSWYIVTSSGLSSAYDACFCRLARQLRCDYFHNLCSKFSPDIYRARAE
jgi:hypothetical protein